MDDIFNNLLVYIPIILIVLFRVLGIRNKTAAKKTTSAVAADRPVAPAQAPRGKPPERRSRKEPPRVNKALPPESAVFPELPVSPAPPPVQSASGRGQGVFPENLDYLPALKRAMVLAEIMGPPKALSAEMGKTGFEPPGPSCGP